MEIIKRYVNFDSINNIAGLREKNKSGNLQINIKESIQYDGQNKISNQ